MILLLKLPVWFTADHIPSRFKCVYLRNKRGFIIDYVLRSSGGGGNLSHTLCLQYAILTNVHIRQLCV
jgi:hypothetical protein